MATQKPVMSSRDARSILRLRFGFVVVVSALGVAYVLKEWNNHQPSDFYCPKGLVGSWSSSDRSMKLKVSRESDGVHFQMFTGDDLEVDGQTKFYIDGVHIDFPFRLELLGHEFPKKVGVESKDSGLQMQDAPVIDEMLAVVQSQTRREAYSKREIPIIINSQPTLHNLDLGDLALVRIVVNGNKLYRLRNPPNNMEPAKLDAKLHEAIDAASALKK